MIQKELSLKDIMPIGRERAALIASTASKYQCTTTLERDGIMLNLKSMIGLLSQTVPQDGVMTLVLSGEDEKEALTALEPVLK